MLGGIKMWVITILIATFIINIVNMILPDSKLKPYINLVLNFIFIFIVLNPIINLFSGNMSLEDKILKSMENYNKEYVQSMSQLSDKTGNKSLTSSYENGLKEVLKLKLDEYGYEVDDIDFNGVDINNIKIKEKSSNKNKNGDIQSNKNEKSKQVFENKDKKQDDKHELNLEKDKLKEDLVKILDVSIETIEID